MESSVEIHRSKLLLKLFTLIVVYMSLCVSHNVVYGGKCDQDWESFYACLGGNRRSLPDDTPWSSDAVVQKKRIPDYMVLLNHGKLPNNMDLVRNSDPSKERIKYSDDVPAFGDDDDWSRHQPKMSDVLKSYHHGSVGGSFARRGFGGIFDRQRGWARRGTPWSSGQDSSTAAGWKKSPRKASSDVTLDEAFSKLKELVARRRMLEKWLMEERDELPVEAEDQ